MSRGIKALSVRGVLQRMRFLCVLFFAQIA